MIAGMHVAIAAVIILLYCLVCLIGRDTFMLKAAESANWKVVEKYLVKYKADANARNCRGYTVMEYAASANDSYTVDLLLQYAAHPSAPGSHIGSRLGLTPLHIATLRGNRDIVDLLISAGADLEAKNDIGMTPLQYAAIGSPSMFHYLVSKGAKIPRESHPRYGSLLHAAATNRYQDTKFLEYLISIGCDPNEKDERGLTPLDKAIESGQTINAAYLSSIKNKNEEKHP